MKITAIACVTFLIPYMIYICYQYTMYLGVIPKQIKVSNIFTFGTRDFGACGAAIFTLSDETYNRITKEKSEFLNTAKKTRAYYKSKYINKPNTQDTYDEWLTIDKSDKYWGSDAAFSGLYCYGSNQVSEEVRVIRKHIIDNGGYYSRIKYNHEHAKFYSDRLLIIPSMKVAVFEHWNY